jgi:hypothetical protein
MILDGRAIPDESTTEMKIEVRIGKSVFEN